MPGTVASRAAALLMLWSGVGALMADAWATPLQRVEFESASQRLVSGTLIPGERIQGDLAKPDGAGPFPAVVGLHGCAGMHDTTKQKLTDELVARGYVVLLVDSYATRLGTDHACTSSAFATFVRRRPDAYGALVFLAGQTFVDPRRVAAVGFSAGARVALSVAEPNSFELFGPPSNLQFRAAAAFYPPCQQAMARPEIPTLIFTGALDDWTPAADCSGKIASWGNDGPPVELVVYPGAYHGFYYPHLKPGTTLFGHWLEYDGEAAGNASQRLHRFLDRHLN
ncbi:dienelactone hydrolase family protein [Bradyrhizobium sp. AUGA SZCCT0222]|uniref:dienelactone hydrolase family protein n=1 Tax=Bradyrhizobium sp. AUGA SZCCT0222 TaxID=2807668 RepID=UPI001BAC8B04|nr:dienelactone hydrolase family protein [Bradyrhizobium sp. AUGA SZCCT0222]MBR1271741.1 dienelactone hydrolase family protein [Bradyrhizobium sp. AUGA SZCCT0222]